MKAEQLYESLREALASDWMSDAEAAAGDEKFGRARESVLTTEEKASLSDPSSPADYPALGEMDNLRHRKADFRIQRLWDLLLPRIGELPEGTVSPTAVTVRTLRTRRLEASTLEAEDGPLILVDSALHDLVILHVSLVLASCKIPFETIGDMPVPGPVLDVSTAVRAACSVHGHLRWTGNLGANFGVALPQPTDNLELRLIEIVEQFVLAHEFAHVYLGHLDVGDARGRMNFGPVEVEGLLPDWPREFEADGLAARLLFTGEEFGRLSPSETLVHLLAVRIALFVLDESVDSRYFSPLISHPSGDSRYLNILRKLFGMYGHPAIEAVEDIISPYFQAYHEQGLEVFEIDNPLSTKLVSCPRVYFLEGADASANDGWEFWEHVFRKPAHVILAGWAFKFLKSHDVALSDVPTFLEDDFDRPAGAQPSPEDQYLTLAAIGEGWFREFHAPRLSLMDLLNQITHGTTYSEMIDRLEIYFKDDKILLCEVIQILQAYLDIQSQRQPQVPQITNGALLSSVQEWICTLEGRGQRAAGQPSS